MLTSILSPSILLVGLFFNQSPSKSPLFTSSHTLTTAIVVSLVQLTTIFFDRLHDSKTIYVKELNWIAISAGIFTYSGDLTDNHDLVYLFLITHKTLHYSFDYLLATITQPFDLYVTKSNNKHKLKHIFRYQLQIIPSLHYSIPL